MLCRVFIVDTELGIGSGEKNVRVTKVTLSALFVETTTSKVRMNFPSLDELNLILGFFKSEAGRNVP